MIQGEHDRQADKSIRRGRSARSPRKRLGGRLKQNWSSVLFVFLAAVFVLSATMLALDYTQRAAEEKELKELAAMAGDSAKIPPTASGVPPVPSPSPIPWVPTVLAQYRELYARNTDMAGWIKIDGTPIDYPVMYTPGDGEFYLTHGFDKTESKSGVPFIDARCTIDPFGTNTIIYGHHMKNGTMFAGLMKYEDVDFYRKHPTIRFDTLYAEQEYEIIAVFRSKIYKKSDTVFKHYNFLNTRDKVDFDEYIANIKALALYDTGTTAEYGDELLTLVTCAYHTENGQFVVVAKK